MAQKRKIENFVIFGFSSLGIAIVVATLYNFKHHGYISFFGDIEDSKLNSFGTFIGGVVGTIFSATGTILVWLTLKSQQKDLAETKKLTQNQIDLSIKPDVFLSDFNLYCFIKADLVEKTFTYEFITLPEEDKYSNLKLINLGVGIAKKIKYNWEFDLDACIENVSEWKDYEIQKIGDGLHFRYRGVAFAIRDDRAVHDIEFLVKFNASNDAVDIEIPKLYLYLLSTSGWKFMTKGLFPKIYLNVNYLDIADKQYHKRFEITIIGKHYTSKNPYPKPNDPIVQTYPIIRSMDLKGRVQAINPNFKAS